MWPETVRASGGASGGRSVDRGGDERGERDERGDEREGAGLARAARASRSARRPTPLRTTRGGARGAFVRGPALAPGSGEATARCAMSMTLGQHQKRRAGVFGSARGGRDAPTEVSRARGPAEWARETARAPDRGRVGANEARGRVRAGGEDRPRVETSSSLGPSRTFSAH